MFVYMVVVVCLFVCLFWSPAMTMQYASYLNKVGVASDAMNSDLSQNQREVCLQSFRDGKTPVLVVSACTALCWW